MDSQDWHICSAVPVTVWPHPASNEEAADTSSIRHAICYNPMMITRDDLIGLLRYDPVDGTFTWRRDVGRRVKAGQTAGCRHVRGFIVIRIRRRPYMAHRLAWLYMTGNNPLEIDHANGMPCDNRFVNLRNCTRTQNEANKIKSRVNTSGYRGVKVGHKGKWYAQIRISGRLCHLGTFTSAEAASEAYKSAAEAAYGEFAGHINRDTTG